MTYVGTLGAVAALAAAAFGQSVNVGKLRFNGVGLDSTYAQVIKVLGKPVKDGKAVREECIGGREKNVEFAGASLYFMDGDSRNKKTFEVKGFEVTSPRYVVSGLKVGDTQLTVRRILGTKFTSASDEETGSTVWTYEITGGSPGFTSIYFKKGKVLKISSAYMVC